MAMTMPTGIERTDDSFAWGAGVGAGVIAGLVFLVAEMMLVWLVNGASPWGPPRMIAAIVMGQGVLPPPATFDFTIVMVAMMVHFALSIALGLLAALLFRRLGMGGAAIAGVVLGLALYYVSFYPIADAMFPWFAKARGGVALFSHALFGLVLGVAYVALRRRRVGVSDR